MGADQCGAVQSGGSDPPPDFVATATRFDLFVILLLMMAMPDRGYWRLLPSLQFLVQQSMIIFYFEDFTLTLESFSMLFVYGGIFLLGVVLSTLFFQQRRQLYALSVSLAQERRVAEAAHQAKSDFFARVSHEIRTPLHSLRGACDLVMSQYAHYRGREQRHLRILDESLFALTELVENVFDLNRMEAGHFSISPAPCALRELLLSVAEQYGNLARKQQLTLSLQVAESVPTWISSDPVRLRQIIINLVSNALKFTPTGTIRIEVTCFHAPLPVLRIAVEDSGVGVPEEKIPHLFDPFYQVDATLSHCAEGMGLGLPISQRLTEQLGGRITVATTAGAGSCFTLELPLVPVAAPRTAASGGSLPQQTTQPPPGRSLVVLVVEDNRFNRVILGDQLLQMGQEPKLVDHGAAALAQIEARSFDLVLMDIRLPGMTGLELARAIREKEQARPRAPLPLVAVTAELSSELAAEAAQAGIDRILSKPLSIETLQALLVHYGADIVNEPYRISSLELHARLRQDFARDPSRAENYRQLLVADLTRALQQLRDQVCCHSPSECNTAIMGEQIHVLKSLMPRLDPGEFTDRWQAWLSHRTSTPRTKQLKQLDALLAVCEAQHFESYQEHSA